MAWEWDEEAARAQSLLRAEEFRAAAQKVERESSRSAVAFSPWRAPSIPQHVWQGLASTWRWVRLGRRGDPAAENLAIGFRRRGYVDAPPGVEFIGDLEPEKMIYVGIHQDAHREQMADMERRHQSRVRELVTGVRDSVVDFARQSGAEVREARAEAPRMVSAADLKKAGKR